MSQTSNVDEPRDGAIAADEPVSIEEIGHPRGTLAILAIYMLLFVLGWLGIYLYQFLPRGTPDSLAAPPAHSQSHSHPGGGNSP